MVSQKELSWKPQFLFIFHNQNHVKIPSALEAHHCHEHNAGSYIEGQEGRTVLRGNNTVKATNGVSPEKYCLGIFPMGIILESIL